MKSLSDYVSEPMSKMYEEEGVFFAFSLSQYEANAKPDVVYVNGPGGMIIPKPNVKRVLHEISRINSEGIAKDIAENGIENIIRRELVNYECCYSHELDDCIDALSDYEVDRAKVYQVFRQMLTELAA